MDGEYVTNLESVLTAVNLISGVKKTLLPAKMKHNILVSVQYDK